MILPILCYFLVPRPLIDSGKYLKTVYIHVLITLVSTWILPEINDILIQSLPLMLRIFLAIVMLDLVFGTIHKAFHTKLLWRFHQKHHEIGVYDLHGYNALYSSVTEHIFVNLLPAYITSIWFVDYEKVLWFSFMLFNSSHSHYHDTNQSIGYHQLHHLYPNRNFGISLGLFDWLIRSNKLKFN